MRSIPRVTRKGAVTSDAIFGSLQFFPRFVRFINDNELCSVPDDHWNSSNLT